MYLDYNATAPYTDKVIAYLRDRALTTWQNASSEYALSRPLDDDISSIRRNISEFLDCSPKEIIFTSGGTESTNLVLSFENLKSLGVETIISSRLEHHATLDKCLALEKMGFNLKFVENNSLGEYDLSSLEELCNENPGSMVSLLYVNNETGVINDAAEVSKIVKKANCFLHFDAVQALGKVPHSLFDIDPDFVSYSGHKIGSLKGVGLLFISSSVNYNLPFKGGAQEQGRRPGTLNYLGIKTLGLAIEDIDFTDLQEKLNFREELEKGLLSVSDNFKVNGSEKRAYNTVNLYLGGLDSREVLLQLSSKGIQVSTGSACTAGSVEPSHVIQAMGYNREYARSCLRFSFKDKIVIDDLTSVLKEIIKS